MIKRHLERICFSPKIGRQMRFIAGPRQSGKTTLAKAFLAAHDSAQLYYNWDLRQIRDSYKADEGFFESAMRDVKARGSIPWICFDEIHKMPHWKNILKGIFDRFEAESRFIIMGSARLEWFRKAGDSLAGRYFPFRLNPLSLSEVAGRPAAELRPDESAAEFVRRKLGRSDAERELLDGLLQFSGFPEPFMAADESFYRRWQRDTVDALTREDIRNLTRILAVEHVATILQLLPERVGSPLSLNALREDVETSYTTIKNAVRAMELTYAIFTVSPYSRKIARAVKKERKAYFYDWGRCPDPAKLFENYVAVELKSMIDLWHDAGLAEFELMYVRMKDGKETDFLITKNREPWCLFEAKLQDGPIARHHAAHARALGDIPLVQIVREDGILKKEEKDFFRMSASRFFA
jgi:predicted AAA+ superfamily ATPase